ncbi:MAG: hypothetical protein IKI93_13060, partial [Clostridia bacterium]|nr:hypothetical protein [Clostridia bacterium]
VQKYSPIAEEHTMLGIGIDIGTTTICGVLFDDEQHAVLKSVTHPNDSFIVYPEKWKKRQDPVRILAVVYEILDELSEEGRAVSVIGLTGQMHGIVYIDSGGNAVSELYTWQDGSGEERMEQGESYAECLGRLTGYPMATGYGLVTHFYNIKTRSVPEKARKICTIQDYIGIRLTERKEPLVHVSDAASFGGFSIQHGEFDRSALKAAEIDVAILPEITDEQAILGTYRGIPVTTAIGDNQASFLGAVQDTGNSLLVNIGTGSQISVMTTSTEATENTEIRPFLKGSYLLVGSSLCGGRAYAALERFFRSYAVELGMPEESQYDTMNRLAEQVYHMTSEEKLEVATTFYGTRRNPNLRGSIRNLAIDNLTPAHMIAGFLEGTVSELYQLYTEMKTVLPERPSILIGSGNGLRKNRVWRDMASELFGMELHLTVHQEEASCGAAIFGLKAVK